MVVQLKSKISCAIWLHGYWQVFLKINCDVVWVQSIYTEQFTLRMNNGSFLYFPDVANVLILNLSSRFSIKSERSENIIKWCNRFKWIQIKFVSWHCGQNGSQNDRFVWKRSGIQPKNVLIPCVTHICMDTILIKELLQQ